MKSITRREAASENLAGAACVLTQSERFLGDEDMRRDPRTDGFRVELVGARLHGSDHSPRVTSAIARGPEPGLDGTGNWMALAGTAQMVGCFRELLERKVDQGKLAILALEGSKAKPSFVIGTQHRRRAGTIKSYRQAPLESGE